jgi:cell division protein FtsQ
MARRKRRNNRRRRGSFSFLYKALSIIIICGAILGALVVFFKVNHVEVTGNSRYSVEEIRAASGVTDGQNLFLLNKYKVSEQIFGKLAYVESVQINRRLPDTLCISVTECTSVAAVQQEGSTFLLSGTGKIVEQTSAPDQAAVVTGVQLNEPRSGTMAAATPEGQAALDQLLTVLQQLELKGMLGATQEIHLEDASAVRLRYDGRFTVEFLWGADFSYKLDNLNAVIAQLQPNETGTINLTQEGKANFIPD